ncbi:MAG: hypothetical protein RR690_03135 [Longicatena sp.]
MANMTNEIKRYVTYFAKSNLRVFILEMIIMFILIPFVVYNEANSLSDLSHGREYFTTIAFMSIFIMFVLSIGTPLYIFRYLHRKQSCDLYFSLPIKRSHQFIVHYILGALLALIPLYINGFVATFIVCIGNPNLIISALGFFGTLTISFLVLYSFFTFLVLKCNNLLDSIIISGAYVVLPIIMIMSLGIYLSSRFLQVFVSYIYIANELVFVQKIFTFISYPFVTLYYFIDGNNYLLYITTIEIIMYSILWLLVGVFVFYIARKAYIARREEDAEQRSTALCTYPFVIMASTISFVLLVFALDVSKVAPTIIIFILYIIMIFFANRKIKLRLKDILFFFFIYVFVFGFSFAFQQTKAFGLVKEVPSLGNVISANVEIMEYSLESDGRNYEFNVSSRKDLSAFLDLHEKLMKDSTERMGIDQLEIYIEYDLKDGRDIRRNYSLDKTELENLLNTIEEIKK